MERILQEWEDFAREIWPGDVPEIEILRDHADEMLRAVAADIQTPQSELQRRKKSLGDGDASAGSASVDLSSTRHALSRVESGFDLRALVSEFRALRASVLHLWSLEPAVDVGEKLEDMTRFNEAIDQLLAESVLSYTGRINHSRDVFLGILGHDLRSPLSAVSMLAGMLEEHGDLNGMALQMASQITVSVKAMERMTKDLLDFTSTRLGAKMTLQRQPMDLGQLGREVIEELRTIHPTRVFDFETKGSCEGEWDPSRLRQLISNLLGNAVQHGSPDTPIGLYIDGSADEVVFHVRNQGNPIPRDSFTIIFDPMRRSGDENLSRPVGSIGLGLYIAREVATAHGGTISVGSGEEETVFLVRLPRKAGRV
ncbi:HAMP domain-containing histidine kinase [Luteolibacter yonseiensis]|uniref:histidine kinase n=1 Tax=Luteolibacter yonseiensis TaxID=1144680 RepID=A0A934VDQ3_9BACT|nr:HAMP domain-containing sensor histidine kinase [Luteolibacter yonseiensis]MBK1818375.1 HAMP domain-containing histidine kinase [Luteolibacter yonseiensis]